MITNRFLFPQTPQRRKAKGASDPSRLAQHLPTRQPVGADLDLQTSLRGKVVHILRQQVIGRARAMRDDANGLSHRAKDRLGIGRQKDREQKLLEPGEVLRHAQKPAPQMVHRQMGEDGKAQDVVELGRQGREPEIAILNQLVARQTGAVGF